MPIKTTVYRPDRLVIAVATDAITLADLQEFVRELRENDLHRLRKIVDLSAAKPAFSVEELAAFIAQLLPRMKNMGWGAIAIVADTKMDEFARIFASLTTQDRPAEVFRSIHDARKWLAASAFPR